MAGLTAGRIIILIADGLPSVAFAFGLLGEFVLAVFGLVQLKKNRTIKI